MCSCGEIFVDGGDSLKCGCRDWNNFMRVDDEGKEFPVKVIEDSSNFQKDTNTRARILLELEVLLENIQSLPPQAMTTPINHYDFASLLMVLVAIFKEDRISSS